MLDALAITRDQLEEIRLALPEQVADAERALKG
jgi:hypothetical protein